MKTLAPRMFLVALALFATAVSAEASARSDASSSRGSLLQAALDQAFSRVWNAGNAGNATPATAQRPRTISAQSVSSCGYLFTLCYLNHENSCLKWQLCLVKYDEGGSGAVPVE